MDKRFALFIALSVLVLLTNAIVQALFFPPQPVAQRAVDKPANADKAKPAEKHQQPPVKAGPADPAAQPDKPAREQELKATAQPQRWVMLGSMDPKSEYRMLVTLTNKGAAIERAELNNPKFLELENYSGYLGRPALVVEGGRLKVIAVGGGTPAAKAGLKAGDFITSIAGKAVSTPAGLTNSLAATHEGQTVPLVVNRAGANKTLSVTLTRRPLEILRPEYKTQPLEYATGRPHDPFSMLMTLERVDQQTLGEGSTELNGVDLISGNWEIANQAVDRVTFRKLLPKLGLEVIKSYKLAKVDPAKRDPDANAYHLGVNVEVRNVGQEARTVGYRLDGPTGLVLEGAWYASKVNQSGGSGLRDIVVKFFGKSYDLREVGATYIADDKVETYTDAALEFAAVDGQYFAAALVPEKAKPDEIWFERVRPIKVGEVPADSHNKRLTDISFRLSGASHPLPAKAELRQNFTLFLGPKNPDLLATYGTATTSLDSLIYYGWFFWVAKPMLAVLHFFHGITHNYAISIVLLTVLVRGCMFPLSRKQALSAQKMQELQPEIKRINEKYKKNAEERTRQQQELFRKHNYNPLGGCLLMFIQLPIFIGLYRSLMVDVELRQAPLLSESIRWASNLGAPDMLMRWDGFMPAFIVSGLRMGPYLNVLPLVTIALFIWQQKMFMPPPADEQAALQQKMMQYMMIFMGFMFYTVASGLCLYFIASSLWGIAERKLLPKTIAAGASTEGAEKKTVLVRADDNGAKPGKKKQRDRR